MNSAADFLVELGTEELPPTALKKLSQAFADGIEVGLRDARLAFDPDIVSFATPRRLAVLVKELQCQQADQSIEKLGPAVAAAFDDNGDPKPAAIGFARSNNVTVEQLTRIDTDKGQRLCFKTDQAGAKTSALLASIVESALDSLPIPKRMRWGATRSEFVRPAHWLLMLLGDDIVEGDVLGLPAGRKSFGHRFHAPAAIEISSPHCYEKLLEEEGDVIADFARRRDSIAAQVHQQAKAFGGVAIVEEALLDEVTALVEKPVALGGHFDSAFLDVPQEALIYSMSEHQKYFHMVDEKGALLPHFITIANIESRSPEKVIAGNERVIRPRLADAAFFYATDRKISLAMMRERLKPIVFQQQLGTVFAKTERIAALASHIASQIGAEAELAHTAGELCKADLASDMVLEFDKMQGTAGAYYARHEKLDPRICDAIKTHYWPRFAGDKVPDEPIAIATALADRLDTLTGIFAIGQLPSGSKDPFALRRAAIGVLQILLQNQLPLDLAELVERALAQHTGIQPIDNCGNTVLNFLFDRFPAIYHEQGLPAEVLLSVRARNITQPLDFDRRVQAVAAFVDSTEAAALAAANKRVGNILQKATSKPVASDFDAGLIRDNAEQALAEAIACSESECSPLFEAGEYEQGLLALTTLRPVIDTFFDDVMVNADDPSLQANRLALLARLHQLFLQVADISQLVTAKQ